MQNQMNWLKVHFSNKYIKPLQLFTACHSLTLSIGKPEEGLASPQVFATLKWVSQKSWHRGPKHLQGS